MKQYKVKFRNDEGKVTSVTVTAPNMFFVERHFSASLIAVMIPQTTIVLTDDGASNGE